MKAGSHVVYTLVATVAVTHTSSHRYAMLAVYSGETQYTVFLMWYVEDLDEVSRIICMTVHRSQRNPDSSVHITWCADLFHFGALICFITVMRMHLHLFCALVDVTYITWSTA
jgi:hypothetical protein